MSKTYIHTYVRAKYMHEDTDYIHTYITVRYNLLAAGSGLDEVTAPRLRCVARHKKGGVVVVQQLPGLVLVCACSVVGCCVVLCCVALCCVVSSRTGG